MLLAVLEWKIRSKQAANRRTLDLLDFGVWEGLGGSHICTYMSLPLKFRIPFQPIITSEAKPRLHQEGKCIPHALTYVWYVPNICTYLCHVQYPEAAICPVCQSASLPVC